MSQVTEFICDECGARSKDIMPYGVYQDDDQFSIFVGNITKRLTFDFCSQGCVTRMLSNFFSVINQQVTEDIKKKK